MTDSRPDVSRSRDGTTIDTQCLAGDRTDNPDAPDNAVTSTGLHGSAAETDPSTAAKTEYLRRVSDRPPGSSFGQAAGDVPSGIQTDELESVPVTHDLYGMLQRELERSRQLEREISGLRAALAQARAELAGIRMGEQLARHLALHDSLTSLPNRRFFLERLDQVLTQVQPESPSFAVLYLDLDDFKPVNDLHGHAAGDRVLGIIAARLSRAVRSGDIISRVGGDEFACLVLNLHPRVSLNRLARKLVDVVSAPMKIGGPTIIVRPSIGIATYPSDGATATELLQSADQAMYHAKRHKTDFAFADQHIELKTGGRRGPPRHGADRA